MSKHKEFVLAFAEGWAKRDVDFLGSLMDPEVNSFYAGMEAPTGIEGVKSYIGMVIELAPDIELKPTRWAAAGDDVFIEWSAKATVGRNLIEWQGTDRFTLKDGKVIEGRAYFDTAPIQKAFGASVGERVTDE